MTLQKNQVCPLSRTLVLAHASDLIKFFLFCSIRICCLKRNEVHFHVGYVKSIRLITLTFKKIVHSTEAYTKVNWGLEGTSGIIYYTKPL